LDAVGVGGILVGTDVLVGIGGMPVGVGGILVGVGGILVAVGARVGTGVLEGSGAAVGDTPPYS